MKNYPQSVTISPLQTSWSTPFRKMLAVGLGLAALAAAPAARAVSATWNGTTSGIWSDGTNWSTSPVPGTGDTATFNNAGNGNTTLDLGGGVTINTIAFDTATAAGYTIGSGGVGAQTLTFNTLAAGNALTMSNTVTQSQIINANILHNTADNTLRIVNAITAAGSPGITINGTIQGGTGATARVINTSGNVTINGSVTGGSAPSVSMSQLTAGFLTFTGGTSTLSTLTASTGRITINGGTVSSSALSTFGTNGSLDVVSGTVNYNGGLRTSANDGNLFRVNGGTLNAASVQLQRTGSSGNSNPLTSPISTSAGLVVTSGTANITGALQVGTSNSAATTHVNGGTLTVGGQITVGNTTNTRYSGFQVSSGTFTSTDAVGGLVLSAHATTANLSIAFFTGGTSTIERIAFGTATSTAGSVGTINLNGASASLYVGAGGIVKPAPTYTNTFNLTAGTLGAKSDWSSSLPFNLNGSSITIKAADVTNVAKNITLSGNLTGGGGITKTGGGILSLSGANAFTGTTNINEGTLLVTPSALNGTGVSVATGATLATQSATNGTLTAGSIALNDGATLLGRPLAAGVQITIPAATIGSITGGTVAIDTTTLGNPTASPLIIGAFDPVAGSKISVLGSNLTVGTFPAVSYTTLGGGGFAGLSLTLPFRVAGNLVDNSGASSVDVNITSGAATPVWAGTVNGNWDIDTVGNGSVGTANWTAASGPNTYVEATGVGVDSVIFSDAGAAQPNVNLTTVITPTNITANHTINYTFSGSGRIAGTTSLIKSDTGTLTLANTGTNDYSGGTTINGGTVRIGDGTTSGAGTIGSGTVTINSPGSLELNRPDNFTLTNALTGSGTILKSQANTATLSGAITHSGPVTVGNGTLVFSGTSTLNGAVAINAGALNFTGAANITNTLAIAASTAANFSAGGNVSGIISGNGALNVTAGTLQLSGTSANTFTGTTVVAGGTLQLNKTGVNAITGPLSLTGTGIITFTQANQIEDTVTITYNKPVANSGSITIAETVGAVNIVDGNNTGAQVLANTGFVANTVSVGGTGVFSLASSHSATVGGITLTGSGIARVSGNTGASTLNVGSGGITASGGDVQVKFNTTNTDATLNLDGDVTTTGNVTFSNGGYTGANLNVISLTGTRTFNIGTGTLTTVAPDIGGTGSFVKSGAGTLQLTATSTAAPTGGTTVNAGTLDVRGSISGTVLVDGATAILAGTGTIGDAVLLNGGTIAPGASPGLLTLNTLTMGTGTTLSIEINSTTPATGYDQIAITTGVDITGSTLALGGTYLNPAPAGELFFIGLNNGANPVTGTFSGLANGASVFSTSGQEFQIGYFGDSATTSFTGGNDIVLMAVPEPASASLLLLGLGLGLARRRRRS